MLNRLKHYLSCDLRFTKEDFNIDYPVAYLDDIKIYFMHYSSEKEALEKWNERKKRIDINNLFILFSDRNGCTYDDLQEFDKLPYTNKVVLCHVQHHEIKSAYYISGFENENQVGVLLEYRYELLQKRYIDDFKYVEWLNKKIV